MPLYLKALLNDRLRLQAPAVNWIGWEQWHAFAGGTIASLSGTQPSQWVVPQSQTRFFLLPRPLQEPVD